MASGLAETPAAERTRIVLLGRRNAGKSSLLNALCGQPVALVSPAPGTTADPVRKAVEWLPLGPCLLVDTAGVDDDAVADGGAAIGALRAGRARREIREADLAVLVTDAATGFGPWERALAAELRDAGTAFVLAVNRIDEAPATPERLAEIAADAAAPAFAASAATGEGVAALRDALASSRPEEPASQRLLADRLRPGDLVVLVVPIDGSAPKGRLILPQQLALRDILDAHAAALVAQPAELPALLAALPKPPRLVVTDSQVFAEVRAVVPKGVPLTGFSILMARYKGDWNALRAGASAVDSLRDGDRVLVCEGCTHRRQCGDIGTVKIPRWLAAATGRKLQLDFASGRDWPSRGELRQYALVVHCGGCMLSRREMRARVADCAAAGVPVVNYGVLIAKLRGVEFDF